VDLPGVGRNFQDQPSMFMEFSCMYSGPFARTVVGRGNMADIMADSNYPFPSPDWITSNASWAAEQLGVYYANRTGT